MSIGKEKAMAILLKIANYLGAEPELMFCTDIGGWNLIATTPSGEVDTITCSLCGGVIVEDIDLTDFIRGIIPIKDLAVFGGGTEE